VYPSCPFCNYSIEETAGEGDFADQYCTVCMKRLPIAFLLARAEVRNRHKLDSPEAKALDERRAVSFEAVAERLLLRAHRQLLGSSRRGCVAVGHTINFLEAKARRLKAIASRARYRNRRRDEPQEDGGLLGH
jgi:hypothetical protein